MNIDARDSVASAGTSSNKTTNVLIVGVGGQGVVLISKVLARICQLHDLDVKQSEVHGMAKRGGSVFSHVRFGAEVFSPTIAQGEADVLLALEWAEGLRWLPYLNSETGTFIVDTKKIVPPFSCRDRQFDATARYPDESVAEIVSEIPASFALDATESALELGNERVANTILLGVLSTVLDFPESEWLKVLAESVPARTLKTNEQAFRHGQQSVARARSGEAQHQLPDEAKIPGSVARRQVSFQIVEPWCKGCDICVKMCPERCLRLNDNQIAELSDPNACTGCRLCEWLCPDLAIKIRIEPSADVTS